MTTTELIVLLQKMEQGSSGRPRNISIAKKDKRGRIIEVMKEEDMLVFDSSGDGVSGAELGLIITNKNTKIQMKKDQRYQYRSYLNEQVMDSFIVKYVKDYKDEFGHWFVFMLDETSKEFIHIESKCFPVHEWETDELITRKTIIEKL